MSNRQVENLSYFKSRHSFFKYDIDADQNQTSSLLSNVDKFQLTFFFDCCLSVCSQQKIQEDYFSEFTNKYDYKKIFLILVDVFNKNKQRARFNRKVKKLDINFNKEDFKEIIIQLERKNQYQFIENVINYYIIPKIEQDIRRINQKYDTICIEYVVPMFANLQELLKSERNIMNKKKVLQSLRQIGENEKYFINYQPKLEKSSLTLDKQTNQTKY